MILFTAPAFRQVNRPLLLVNDSAVDHGYRDGGVVDGFDGYIEQIFLEQHQIRELPFGNRSQGLQLTYLYGGIASHGNNGFS